MSVASLATTRLTIKRATITRDNFGGKVEAFATVGTVRGRVQPLSGQEQQLYSRDTERVTHKVYIAGTPDVQHKDRLTYVNQRGSTRTLEVRAVRDIDVLGRFVTVEAEELR